MTPHTTNPVLPDVLVPNLDIVFCGTAAGKQSAQRQAYYAHPGNKFWRTLFEIGLTPVQLAPEQYKEVIKFSLGMTDLIKDSFGADTDLSYSDGYREQLRAKLRKYRPSIVAFTSKTAAEKFLGHKVEYGRPAERVEGSSRSLFESSTSTGCGRSLRTRYAPSFHSRRVIRYAKIFLFGKSNRRWRRD